VRGGGGGWGELAKKIVSEGVCQIPPTVTRFSRYFRHFGGIFCIKCKRGTKMDQRTTFQKKVPLRDQKPKEGQTCHHCSCLNFVFLHHETG